MGDQARDTHDTAGVVTPNSRKREPLEIRWNIIGYLLVSAALLAFLGLWYNQPVATIGAAASVIGVVGAVLKQLISPSRPKPDPAVDQGRITPGGAVRVWRSVIGKLPDRPIFSPMIAEAPRPQVRPNFMIMMVMGAGIVVLMGILFKDHAVAVIPLGQGLLSFGGASVLELVSPRQPEPDPEVDEGQATPAGFELMALEARRSQAAG